MSANFLKAPDPHGYRRASGVRRIDTSSVAPPPLANGARPHLELRLNGATATVLLSCPAAEDAAAAFLTHLSAAGARLIASEQCTDAESESVFQRIHTEISRVQGGAAAFERLVIDVANQFSMTTAVQRTERRKRVALFVSKYDHCLYDLLLRQRAGELDCDIPVVISNHPDLKPVVGQFGVDYELISKSAANKREAEERECAVLRDRSIDLVVLARYMQVMSETFVHEWDRRIINIHHSFLPAFIGARPYHQAQKRGVKLIGATAHYATANLDEGPIIEQDVVRCDHKDTVEDLVRKGRDLEKLVLSRAVRWHLDNRVIVHGNKTVVFD